MGLPRAIQAHKEGNLALAATHYKRALDQAQYKPLLFQNYGALLRGNGELDQAEAIYRQGLEMYPEEISILRNYANLMREKREISDALQSALRSLRIALRLNDDNLEIIYCECIDLLRDQGSLQWALALLRQALADIGVTTKLLWALFRISSHDGSSAFDARQSQLILDLVQERLNQAKPIERAEFLFTQSFYFVKREKIAEAVGAIEEAHGILKSLDFADENDRDKAQALLDLNSWNASCILLKAPRFQQAWKLFEYGLRAPAVGKQRWQRHLKKMFTHKELPLWRGESLRDRRLLLLEEQAIGDTMMFLTLLPTLVQMSNHVGLVVSSRLFPIYQRSCRSWIEVGKVSVWSHEDAPTGRLDPKNFDYQSPVGSICQYIANRIESFSPKTPILIADTYRTSAFKGANPESAQRPLRIGISWRGGGRSDRIKLKSIDKEMLAGLMRDHSKKASFVNLQYGDVSEVVSHWQSEGLPVVHEPSVNPLKNMEEWLNLVASCDAVISVANTTIHGAGGLNIPTLCLLSRHCDWRWLTDPRVERSYWYPSVGIARETLIDGWSSALKQTSHWIQRGCPMPDGLVYTNMQEPRVEHASVVLTGVGARR